MSGALAQVLADALERGGALLASTAGERIESGAILRSAMQVTASLRSKGARPEEPVLVAIRNRPADLGALLGTWLAGAVAVPIHHSAAPTTLRSLQDTTAARFMVDQQDVHSTASSPPPERLLLSGAALVIFTSGSTGRPKGVVIGHKRFAGKLDVLSRLLQLKPDDTIIVPLQLTFVFGLWVSLLTLRSGGSLVLMPKFSGEAAAALDEGGTVLAVVPSMLRALLSGPRLSAPALRCILSGGEALGTALAGTLGQALPSTGLYDLYGLTETGSCDFCLPPADQPAGVGSLGFPTERVNFRLVDGSGRPVSAGTPGELQIRTPFGMLGYLDDEALTTASFNKGFFRTGDLARVRPDGRVELVGRSKEIIVRGGNKIAPLEIDNLLASHPEVVAALCAGVPDVRLGEAIHAAVVLKPGAKLTGQALRQWALERIERYKVPDFIHVRNALPVGSTGKANRSALAIMFAEEK